MMSREYIMSVDETGENRSAQAPGKKLGVARFDWTAGPKHF